MPSYLKSLFSVRTTECNFRNRQFKLNLPKPRTKYLKRSLCYNGASLCNSLPQEYETFNFFRNSKKLLKIILLMQIILLPHGNLVNQFQFLYSVLKFFTVINYLSIYYILLSNREKISGWPSGLKRQTQV